MSENGVSGPHSCSFRQLGATLAELTAAPNTAAALQLTHHLVAYTTFNQRIGLFSPTENARAYRCGQADFRILSCCRTRPREAPAERTAVEWSATHRWYWPFWRNQHLDTPARVRVKCGASAQIRARLDPLC